MKPIKFFFFVTLIICGNISYGMETGKDTYLKFPVDTEPGTMPDLVRVKASLRQSPPDWAVMERKLIEVMEKEAAPFFIENFTRPDGETYRAGQWDDVYEMFQNWCTLYSIGGDEKLYKWALKEYNAITDELTPNSPKERDAFHMLYKEFIEGDDWFHIGEAVELFYGLPLANPALPQNIDRAKRFAGLYLNEDPEAQNYDFQYKIIKSIGTGSKGAMDSRESSYDLKYNHATLYPVVKALEPGWNKDKKRRDELQKLYDKIVTRCDVPVNLGATGLVTNAYLYTGDEKYKKWVLDYVDAWMQRIKDNKGILPDNIGRTGKIGEYRNGQWWGGLYGWTGTYSIHMIFGALSVASECAYLVSGDPKYLDLLRSQIDVLLAQSKMSPSGELLVPYKYGPEGWFDYRPFIMRDAAHLWHASMNPEDWKRVEKVLNGNPNRNNVPVELDRGLGDSEYPRLLYYSGKKPDWPYEILAADYQFVINRMEWLLNTKQEDLHKISEDWLHYSNPLAVKGLQQVTMGAPQSIYNGGLLTATVRYFDIDKIRPGLPQDVAALVKEIAADHVVIELVNLSTDKTRNLIVQAGAFGEHNFTNVAYKDNVIVNWPKQVNDAIKKEDKEMVTAVNSKYLSVEMAPGTQITLSLGLQRHVNKPSYAFPWHGGSVPQD
jgi:hypothetical protein